MIYCKYCYRVLDDGTEICTSCGKSQIGFKKRQKTFLGLFPVYKEKDLNKAKEIFHHADAAYKLAKDTTTIFEFTLFWDMLVKDNSALRTYENLVSPDNYLELSVILDKEDEFQWRLRDAIERSAKNAISDMKGEYRNNIGARVDLFTGDVSFANDLADPETIKFIIAKKQEVANFAKIELPNSMQQKNRGHMLNEYAKYGGIDAELLTIDLMEGHAFEHWCANLLRDLGYINVSVTPGSGDQCVDVLAEKDSIKYAIQCKCYSSNLGNTPIQEVNAGKSFYRCHVGVVMTNQYFTPKAIELAEATGTLLWDRNWITNYLKSKASTDGSLQIAHSNGQVNLESQIDYVEGDGYFPAAVEVVLETGQASVSMIQRRLKLGYAHAARLLDEMEEKGFVGPFCGSAPRAILITEMQWQQIRHK